MAGLHYGGKNELVVLNGAMNQQVHICVLQQSFFPGQERPSRTALSWSKIMLRPAQPEPPGEPGRGSIGLAIQKSGYEPIELIWDQIAIHIRGMDNALIKQEALREQKSPLRLVWEAWKSPSI